MAQKKVLSDESKVIPAFSIALQLGNEHYSSQGKDAQEAIDKLALPRKIAVKGIMTLTKGDKVKTFALAPIKMKRMFYPLSRFYLAKSFELLMK
jgi:hypothetical protein